MKVLLSWLNEFLPHALTGAEAEESLVSNGIEVAAVRSLAAGLENVVVAKVLEYAPHPDADRLRLCKVTDGVDTLDIVCGAKNFEAGSVVALAKVGAKLPNGLEIKKSKIRGVASFGMLCSEEELGFKDAAEGILILPPDAPVGRPLADYLGRNDSVVEVELTPNRGDCLSVVGLAQEIAAHRGVGAKVPSVGAKGAMRGDLRLSVEDAQGCPRYSLQLFDGVTVVESAVGPLGRLAGVGLRNINSVVDITNYVMWERGQPLHAFDADKVAGGIAVRRARAGEKLLCLDGETRALDAADLVIADDNGPIAIAGVIGGADSGVSAGTRRILLESAHFEPSSVRKTAKRHGLHTDSSHRFERFVDPTGAWSASLRARELLEEFCGARQLGEADVVSDPAVPVKIRLRRASVLRHLGQEVKGEGEYLSRLGFTVERREDDYFVEVPVRRPDVTREIDLIEEIARLHGYGNFPSKLPPAVGMPPALDGFARARALKEFLAATGYLETRGYSFAAAATNAAFARAGEHPVRVLNGLTADMQEMRVSLVPQLLDAWKRNRERQAGEARLFELAKTYAAVPTPAAARPAAETLSLGLLVAGSATARWQSPARALDFFDLKAVLEALSDEFNLRLAIAPAAQAPAWLHPGIAAEVRFRGKSLGFAGALHPTLAASLDVGSAFVAELDAGAFLDAIGTRAKYKAYSVFPYSEKDLAFIVDDAVASARIVEEAQALKIPHLASIELFDVYRGKGVPAGKKSLAYAVRFMSREKTLTDAEIGEALTKIVETAKAKLGAQLRS